MTDILERLRRAASDGWAGDHEPYDLFRDAANEIERLVAIVNQLPKTTDGHYITPGMPLTRAEMDAQDLMFPPIADIRAYWVDMDGVHIVDDPTKFSLDMERLE